MTLAWYCLHLEKHPSTCRSMGSDLRGGVLERLRGLALRLGGVKDLRLRGVRDLRLGGVRDLRLGGVKERRLGVRDRRLGGVRDLRRGGGVLDRLLALGGSTERLHCRGKGELNFSRKGVGA